MREYGFWLNRILLYKDKIVDFVHMRENTGHWKPVMLPFQGYFQKALSKKIIEIQNNNRNMR